MKTGKIIFVLLYLVLITIGCQSVNQGRRVRYVRNHPVLEVNQKDLLLKGKLWVGMNKDAVRASIGSPTSVSKDMLGKEEVWTYIYKDQYTPHRDYKFERGLRLEFKEGRLADWRED